MEYLEEKNENSKYLLFFLHGYCTNMHNLFDLKDEIKPKNKIFSYISVNAPFNCEGVAIGYQWFSLRDHSFPIEYSVDISNNTKSDLKHSVDLFIELVDKKVKEYNIDYKNVYFLGFSQGTVVSFCSACRMENEIGGIIACSGFIREEKDEFRKSIVSKPRVLFLYGDDDDVIKQDCYEKSIKFLEENNFNLTVKKYSGMGHYIEDEEIEDINNYV